MKPSVKAVRRSSLAMRPRARECVSRGRSNRPFMMLRASASDMVILSRVSPSCGETEDCRA
ncbi:MAG: hypothetical protein RIG68_26585 [Imperialibacter sp.]|uniref:hypothetical protein n=1 Tax=Imperialibacter sp. TaxID=2038411 RepID=UPI0032ECBEF1